MNTSFYWHLSFWANAGHNISTVTITNKKCGRPSNQIYSNASSCIKQFESLTRHTTILPLIFLHLSLRFRTLSEDFGLHIIAKTINFCLIMKSENTFLPLQPLYPLDLFFFIIKLINYFQSAED